MNSNLVRKEGVEKLLRGLIDGPVPTMDQWPRKSPKTALASEVGAVANDSNDLIITCNQIQ